MLDLFLKLVSHLQTLLNLRNANYRAIFKDHIEPIYEDIQKVYDDYVATFNSIRIALRDNGTTLESIVGQLKSQREANLRLRQELVAYSTAFRESDSFPEEFHCFCFYVLEIMLREPTGLDVTLSPRTTQIGPFIEFLEQWSDQRFRQRFSEAFAKKHQATEIDFREYAARYIEVTLSNMADSWKCVMKSYFELRVEHLKPA